MSFDPDRKLTRANFPDLPPLCTDGAWGTQLQGLGARPGEMTDGWNVSAPERVLAVAQSYVDAGAQVILTNTFSCNRVALEAHGLSEAAASLARAGAEISRNAARGAAYVFGSVGPTGKLIAMRTIDAAAIREAAAEQAAALAAGGVDAIVIETQAALDDARAALEGCLSACDLPVGVSFSFDSGRDNSRTMMGVRVAEAQRMAADGGASFVGANCGAGIEAMVEVARQFGACGGELPVWIKGNAGTPVLGPDGWSRYEAPVDLYARLAPALLEAGVRFVGGCCGSTPEHIRVLSRALGQERTVR
jgi:methionine synthase I (cobalamin-dependent)